MRKYFITKIIAILFIFSLANIYNISHVYAGWFDKKIKVKKCYRANAKWRNGEKVFKSYKQMKSQNDFVEVELTAEIDLEKEIVIIESVWDNKVSISRHAMLSSTDNYISTFPDPDYGSWVFDLKKETMSGKGSRKAMRCMGDCVYKCDFN